MKQSKKLKERLARFDELARRVLAEPEKPKQQEQETPTPDFSQPEAGKIITSQDYWTITGVNYRNKIETFDLLKSLLDNGNAKTQDQWVEYSKQAKAKGDFYTGDFPLYHAVFKALFLKKDSADLTEKTQVEEARGFLEKQFREKWLMTLTRIAYQSTGEDNIIHNYGMSDEYKIQENFIGPNEWVKDSSTPQCYNTLLGNNNIQEINQIYKWITGVPAYLWRLNSKPKNLDERVARFDAGSDWAGLGCYRDPLGCYESLGVRRGVSISA